MRLRRRIRQATPSYSQMLAGRDLPVELREARKRLIGWKWTGTDPLDLDGLLRDAAYELDARADRIDELTDRLDEAEGAMRSYALRETIGIGR